MFSERKILYIVGQTNQNAASLVIPEVPQALKMYFICTNEWSREAEARVRNIRYKKKEKGTFFVDNFKTLQLFS